MVGEFHQEWALILGGSSGLGLASAKKLAAEGMNICIVHRDARAQMTQIQSDFDEIKKNNIEFQSYNVDAISEEKQLFFMEDFKVKIGSGKIKLLLHSLAKGALKPALGSESLQLEDCQITLNAMALSLLSWTQKLHKFDFFAQDARILSFSSEGSTKVIPNYAAVSLAKASLEALSRTLAVEMAPWGIKSNIIQAGVTDTAALRQIPNVEKLLKTSILRNPQGRLTTAEDVANVVYLLVKKEAFWINGAVIKVDGGESIV
jgi:enoyl-[acyl-carrier protein] reductase III